MAPARRPARCQATPRYARPRPAHSVNIRRNRSATALALALVRQPRRARPVRALQTAAESAWGPVRQPLAPPASTVPLRVVARRRRGTEQETPARPGPSVHRTTAHPPTAFAAIRTARGNARPAARERARESPRASPWEAVPRAWAQPTPLAVGVATTPPTIAIIHPREPQCLAATCTDSSTHQFARTCPGSGGACASPTPPSETCAYGCTNGACACRQRRLGIPDGQRLFESVLELRRVGGKCQRYGRLCGSVQLHNDGNGQRDPLREDGHPP
jgi:hypothetical protein